VRSTGCDRRVLLTAHTVISLKYVLRYQQLLTADPRLEFAVTQLPDQFSTGVDNMIARTGLPVVPIEEARNGDWDLILFGTHGGSTSFKTNIPKVHIQHGLGAGKVVGEQGCFTYGPKWVLRDGKPRYTTMLESSYATRDFALRLCPELTGHVAVVGDPFCDDLLRAQSSRDDLRRRHGIRPDEIAILVTSTWGAPGLLETLGPRFLHEAADLPAGYKVILTMHDHLWSSHDRSGTPWRTHVESVSGDRFHVCKPGDSWVPYLTIADVAIVDCSSLALYFALLQRPTIAAPLPDGVLTDGALISSFRSTCHQLTGDQNLLESIVEAIAGHDPRRFAKHLPDVTSYPGTAASRVRAVLTRLLRL
jgi:CDP-glycerol glycerophosphotransferase (TagB/SpsB family)